MKVDMKDLDVRGDVFRQGSQRLAIAVIISAFKEVKKGNDKDAKWINSSGFDFWCNVAGIDSDFVKEQFAKGRIKLRADIAEYFKHKFKVEVDDNGRKKIVKRYRTDRWKS